MLASGSQFHRDGTNEDESRIEKGHGGSSDRNEVEMHVVKLA